MIQDFLTRLIAAMAHFETQTGIEPTRLYLGHDEHSALIEAAKQFHNADMDPRENEDARLEWMQRKVYEVDAKSYIAFGI